MYNSRQSRASNGKFGSGSVGTPTSGVGAKGTRNLSTAASKETDQSLHSGGGSQGGHANAGHPNVRAHDPSGIGSRHKGSGSAGAPSAAAGHQNLRAHDPSAASYRGQDPYVKQVPGQFGTDGYTIPPPKDAPSTAPSGVEESADAESEDD